MKKGYLFSLEALIAIIILLFPVVVFNANPLEMSNERDIIYEGLDFLEMENELKDNSDILKINGFLGLNISALVCENKRMLDYLIVSGAKDFEIIRVCY